MHIQAIPVGRLLTNCYVVTDPETKACVVIDPGDEGPGILHYIRETGLTPQAVFLTHGHYDHTMAADDIASEWNIPVYIGKGDVTDDVRNSHYRYAPKGETRFWKEGDMVEVGNLKFQVLATPGHSPGSVCLFVGNSLFTGDTLFRDDCGRTDLPGSNPNMMIESLAKIEKLPGSPDVYPGHEESSTLDRERRFNHYLRQAALRK